MPRIPGTGVYEQPAPDVITATTIESTVYNAFVNDVETDLNAPRPVIAGGTGATDATQARDNLDAEVAGTKVLNYETHPWENGSFYSEPGATGAPSLPGYPAGSGYFSGICHKLSETTITLVAQVYDSINNIGQRYTRQKFSGVWKPWVSEGRTFFAGSEGFTSDTGDMFFGIRGTAPSSQFVVNSESDASGVDMLTVDRANGTLSVRPPSFAVSGSAQVNVSKRASGDTAAVVGQTANSSRWALILGDQTAESGGATGSDFLLYRYTNAGAGWGAALTIKRLDAAVGMYGPLTTQGDISVTKTSPILMLNKAASGQNASFQGMTSNSLRWNLAIGNSTAEAGANAGSDCAFYRYDDAGTVLAGGVPALSLKRSDASATFGGDININTAVGPTLNLMISGAVQSCVYDNAAGIIVSSNAAKTQGMYILHGASAWVALSDARLPEKAGAKSLSMLDRIDQIQVYENTVDGQLRLFVIAQEFVKCLPHLVKVGTSDVRHIPTGLDDPDAWGVSYDRAGVAALQLGKEIYDTMRQQIAALTTRIEALEATQTAP